MLDQLAADVEYIALVIAGKTAKTRNLWLQHCLDADGPRYLVGGMSLPRITEVTESMGKRRAVLCVLLVWLQAGLAIADARTDYLVRLLSTSKTFRVRAQAALSLGKVEQNERVVRALGTALNDKHPAVRLAAISSLERIGDPKVIRFLRVKTKDENKSVRRAAGKAVANLKSIASATSRRGPGLPKYYVALGTPAAKVNGVDHATLRQLQAEIENQLLQRQGVVLAPGNQKQRLVQSILRGLRLRGYFLDVSVVSLEKKGIATRAEVSVVLATYPGRDMRATLKGSAIAKGGDPSMRAQNAILGAAGGALRRVATAMEKARPGL